MEKDGGQLLVECLVALGAKTSFGIPGESYLAVLNALHDSKGKLDYILCRNEGGAAFMAAAYGKLTNTPGICFVTRGPGATNAAIGVHTAKQDSVPLLLFVGQISSEMRDREAFQEIDYRAVFGTMAKWATEIDDIERIPEIVSRAWTCATTGRPGPVVIALPENMLTKTTSKPPLQKPITFFEPVPSADALAQLGKLHEKAAKPLILYGGSNWTESSLNALQSFAEKSDIPVVSAFRYQDQFDNFSPVYAGDAGVGMTNATRELIRNADLIIAVNVRFGENTTDGYTLLDVPMPKQRLVHVHISDKELGKIYIPDLAIHAGHNAFAMALPTIEPGDWHDWTKKARNDYEASFTLAPLPSPVDMGKVMTYLQDKLPDDAILTNGAGNFTVWPNKFFKFGKKQRLLAPQSGAMGYGIPAAIAAKAAYRERVAVCFAGDGDFQMNCQELGSAMQAGIQPIILLLNNGIYGTIRAHQERHYPERVFGTTMTNPDFVALAQSYGFHGEKVEKTDDFPAAFERALSSKTGAVLELAISPEALTPRQTLSQMREAASKAQKK